MITFLKLDYEDLELVLKWRTSDYVTKFMYTDIENNMDNQIKWFEKIRDDKTQEHWVIQYKETKIGLFSLGNKNLINKSVTSGFYIGELDYAILSSRILPYYLNYIFLNLGFNKLYIEVFSGNVNIMKMNLHYGFRHVGTLEQHIYKNNKFYDIEVLELLKDKWINDFEKYHRLQPLIKS